MNNQKLGEVIVVQETYKEKAILTINFEVNINAKSLQDPQHCLKECLNQNEDLDVTEFIDRLATTLFNNFEKLRSSGFSKIKEEIEEKLLYVKRNVKIYDTTGTQVVS